MDIFSKTFKDLQDYMGQKIASYNQKTPSVLGNLLTGQTWNQGISTFGGVAPKNQSVENPSIISPIPASDQLTQGLIYKTQLDQLREQQAKTPSTFTPKTVQYPEWMANAPSQQQLNAVNVIRRANPNLQMSNAQIIQYYNQYGNKLLQGLNPSATPTPTPVAQGNVMQPVVSAPVQQPVVTNGGQTISPATLQFLQQNVFPITKQYGIPNALAASQWAVESGRKTQSPINNVYGIGPNWNFPNLQANISAYAQTVNNILKKKGFNMANMSPSQIIMALQEGNTRYEGHNANPFTYVNTVTNTPEWRYFLNQ